MTLLKDFDKLLHFCLEHGGTLRNHKEFGEMAREVRAQIELATCLLEDEETLSDSHFNAWRTAQSLVTELQLKKVVYCDCFWSDVPLTLVNGKCSQCDKPPRPSQWRQELPGAK